MKSTLLYSLLGLALLGSGASAQPADVGVSIQVGQPGFYGRIDLGNAAPPPVVLAQPIWVQPAPMRPQPIYLRVPPGHQKHWARHCREYNACGVPVYFVREDWYQQRYRPHAEGPRGDYRRDEGPPRWERGPERDHDHDRDRGPDDRPGRGHGRERGRD